MAIDYHTHSTYSDGMFLEWMLRAAADAGLDGIGFADHCNVSDRTMEQERRRLRGYNLDATYERRRQALQTLREQADIQVFDAVEMDYAPADMDRIRDFLDTAGFDYVIGSVHTIDGASVMAAAPFRDWSTSKKEGFVDEYVDRLVRLVESGLFDIAAHIDVVERSPVLRGMLTAQHYDRIVDAFVAADTVPEVNAGRVFDDYGKPHPHPDLFERLVDAGVRFTLGSDAHTPEQLLERTNFLQDFVDEHGFTPVQIH